METTAPGLSGLTYFNEAPQLFTFAQPNGGAVMWDGLGLASLSLFMSVVQANAHSLPQPATYAVTAQEAKPPNGWIEFCARNSAECKVESLPVQNIKLTPALWDEIRRVNTLVNDAVQGATDLELWGVAERWDYPKGGKGDCEDYVLEKRKLLLAAGLPRQALLVTVVIDPKSAGHAILTVKTDSGEFVLDNLKSEVKAWQATGYDFVKRQSQTNPNTWEWIADCLDAPKPMANAELPHRLHPHLQVGSNP